MAFVGGGSLGLVHVRGVVAGRAHEVGSIGNGVTVVKYGSH